ncbi:hypothetical protein JCM11491_006918 [Sporobolomyces phaffii]
MTTLSLELLATLSPPRPSQLVHREECTQCFDTAESLGELGLDVCLTCFNGQCPHDSTHAHSTAHAVLTGHTVVLNLVKRRKPVSDRNPKRDSQEPPIKRLAIRREPTEAEEFDTVATVKVFDPRARAWTAVAEPYDARVRAVVDGVLTSMSSARQSEVEAWEEEIVACVHTTDLVQTPPPPAPSDDARLKHCRKCDLDSNLWLCLVCGALGCGRPQFGGGGGNGHGLEHTNETGHAVAVKLGTIQPDGSADVYCYACDDARTDPHLAQHLSTFGIKVAEQTKTEKSMTELQVEQNLNFDFAMTGRDGKELEPVFGPGLTGLKNLGNSCYLASSVQSLFSLAPFQDRYLTAFVTHTPTCTNPLPATCFECQMAKIADGLLSGRYSVPSTRPTATQVDAGAESDEAAAAAAAGRVGFQAGLEPAMLKALVGRDHAEFSTMRQQDASEFLFHLLECIRRSAKRDGTDADAVTAGLFGFEFEERLECTECRRVRYKKQEQEGVSLPVPVRRTTTTGGDGAGAEAKEAFEPVRLEECLENLVAPQEIEYACAACQRKTTALKSTRFSSFPDVLIVNAARFQLDNWVPRKVDVPLVFDPQAIDLSSFVGTGLQPGEQELPEDEPVAAGPLEHSFDQSAIDQLTAMGFPEIRAKRALLKTGNSGGEAAMNWLFEHMDDQDLDDPLPPPDVGSAATTQLNEPSPEQISMLADMGFTPAQGRKALIETGGDANRAVEWLFSHPDDDGTIVESSSSSSTTTKSRGSSDLPARYRLKTFISHKGPSVHSGHYVSHVWTGQADETGQGRGSWVLFNDEKVVRAGPGQGGEASASEWMEKAYVYLFERIR